MMMAGTVEPYADWMSEVAAAVEGRLVEILSGETELPLLAEGMRYAVLDGGKRLRPAVVLAVAGEGSDDALRAACAVELIHCYSLVHDDLPCMDDDDSRRGRPSCHRVYGEAMALLVGDCLQSLAFETVVGGGLPVEAGRCLAVAAGARGMGGGQALDVHGVADDAKAIGRMHGLKTGALFECALRLGLLCRGSVSEGQRRATERFGRAFGLLFQIANDLKDSERDRRGGKMTFATATAVRPQEAARVARDEAVAATRTLFPRLADIALAAWAP